MNILYVYADHAREWNCSQWNCITPAKAVNSIEGYSANTIYINEFKTGKPEVQELCAKADIIVVERNFFGDTLTMMQYWKVRNKTIIAIFDDAYDIMHPQNISYDFWKNGRVKGKDKEGKPVVGQIVPLPIEQFKWGLRIVKAIQVPSVNLAKDWSKYGNTYYVHNFLDIDNYTNIEPLLKHPEDEILIGWHGSMSHYNSFTESGVLDALRKISKEYPQVKILLGGDKRVFDAFDSPNKIYQNYVPKEQFTSLIKSLDIGLAPLSGEFDKRRSWIKVLEYMALQIPWVATNYITYDELKDYGIMTENGYDNWVKALRDAIDNHIAYKERAKGAPYEFAMAQNSVNKMREVTLPLYEKLLKEPYP